MIKVKFILGITSLVGILLTSPAPVSSTPVGAPLGFTSGESRPANQSSAAKQAVDQGAARSLLSLTELERRTRPPRRSKQRQSGATNPIRPPQACPSNLEELFSLLLRDLPSYANRVNQRAYTQYRTAETPGYVLFAGRPEFEPLSLGPGEYTPTTSSDLSQVFFTTLERQYLGGKAIELEQYHWLFLTQTENGWRFVLMYSTLGNYPANEPSTPPRDSSQGVIGRAIRLWLRDCQARSVQG
jgi:hypothetical protein